MPSLVDGVAAEYGFGPLASSAPVIANSATIFTAGVGAARVAPSGGVTGIILQPGTRQNQQVWVIVETNQTVTFAAQATSNVADGATAAIPGLAARLFVWDIATGLWYRAA